MTDEMKAREKAICEVANVNDIGEVSDGFHTFNGLYEQRMILFAALVKAYKDKAWKSYRHEYGEYCFGGGWFIVGIDTPEGSYTYHYENKYWDMFDCVELPRAKHWDGHTEADAETRLTSLNPEPHWIPVAERLPQASESVMICDAYGDICIGHRTMGGYYFPDFCEDKIKDVRAWAELPEPYKGGDGMSVLIKDMDMPKGCEQCCFNGHTKCRRMPIGFEEYPLVGERPDWCPLIEVELVEQEEAIIPLNMLGGYLRKVTT